MLDYILPFAHQSFTGETWDKTVPIVSFTYPNAIFWRKIYFDKYIHHLCSDGPFNETEPSQNLVLVSLKYTVHTSVLLVIYRWTNFDQR